MAVSLFKVHMPPAAVDAAASVLMSGYIGEGPVSRRFEAEFAQWLGQDHICLVDSCTSALTIALHMAGVGPGTEVISSPMTCFAANAAITRLGATVRWADIDPRTGNMDPECVEGLIGKSTVALLFVDWGGQPADSPAIAAIARAHGITTIEDAAHSLGAEIGGRRLTDADFTCYSFQAVKHMTTINGGALRCSTSADAERARLLRWYGLARLEVPIAMAGDIDVVEPGFKMHMVDPNAAIGIVQLEYIDGVLAAHRSNAHRLSVAAAGCDHLAPQHVPNGDLGSYLFLTLLARSAEQRKVGIQLFGSLGVEASRVHRRNDEYSAFAAARVPLPGVDEFSSRNIGIPCGWWLTEEDLDTVADAIQRVDDELAAGTIR